MGFRVEGFGLSAINYLFCRFQEVIVLSRKTFLLPILLLSLALCLACGDSGPPAEPLPTMDFGSAAERAADNAQTAAGAAGDAAAGAAAEMTAAAEEMADAAADSAESMLDRAAGVKDQAADLMEGEVPTAAPLRLPTLTPTPEGMGDGLGLPDRAGLERKPLATPDLARYLEELEKRKVVSPVPLASDYLDRFRHRFGLRFTLPQEQSGLLSGDFVAILGEGVAVGAEASSCEVGTAAFGLIQDTEWVLIPGPGVSFYGVGALTELEPKERWSVEVNSVLSNCFHSAEFWYDWGALEELEGQEFVEETKNGVLARRYDLAGSVNELPLEGLLGPGEPGLPGMAEGSEERTPHSDSAGSEHSGMAGAEGQVDRLLIWVAVDGGWPVAMDMDVDLGLLGGAMLQGMSLPADGGEGFSNMRLVMRGEIYAVNDPAIALPRAEDFPWDSSAENSQSGRSDSGAEDSGSETGMEDSGSDSSAETGAAGENGAAGNATGSGTGS